MDPPKLLARSHHPWHSAIFPFVHENHWVLCAHDLSGLSILTPANTLELQILLRIFSTMEPSETFINDIFLLWLNPRSIPHRQDWGKAALSAITCSVQTACLLGTEIFCRTEFMRKRKYDQSVQLRYFFHLECQAETFFENGPFVQKSSFSTGRVAILVSSRPYCYLTWMFSSCSWEGSQKCEHLRGMFLSGMEHILCFLSSVTETQWKKYCSKGKFRLWSTAWAQTLPGCWVSKLLLKTFPNGDSP